MRDRYNLLVKSYFISYGLMELNLAYDLRQVLNIFDMFEVNVGRVEDI